MRDATIADAIRQKFSVATPLFLATDRVSIKLELKPYLQPFERDLAVRELRALLNTEDTVTEAWGVHIVRTNKSEEHLRQRLAYWQRVGCTVLEPTVQKTLEFTQNGLSSTLERTELHNARRLRYGPHDLHEYRGKFFPQLVRSLMNIAGISDHALVLDPMCGSGTTPCEVLASGRSAIAVDLNPLSVLIARVKSAVVLQSPKVFSDIVSRSLKKFRFKDVDPKNVWSDGDLRYLKLWFDPSALRDLSSVLAEVEKTRPGSYRDFFRVCVSNVIRSVSWQKDVDLRVRKEITSYDPGAAILRFKEEVLKQTDRIYPYLCVLPRPTIRPSLVVREGNAVNVADMFPKYFGKIDLIVTSPPYATALPYLDTDRLSLIALGLLSRERHADIESVMIGTREITERQRRETWEQYLSRKTELPDRVVKLIDRIAERNHGDDVGFRRRNLPALLGRYFLAMLDAMRSARALMKTGARGYYVVGNNSTVVSGEKITIPTDEFLFEIGEAAGWTADETVPMELLVSRDIFRENRGTAETILCFKVRDIERKAIYTTADVQALAQDGREWNFRGAETEEHLHNLHSYPAKFIPQIPRKAIETWTTKGELVYDPFVGCGTTLLEASLLRRPSIGTDNNAVAILVSKAKTANYTARDLDALRNFAFEIGWVLRSTKPRKELIPKNRNFLYWFSGEVLDRLSALKGLILSQPEPAQTMLLAVFSSIIVRVSYQDSDTRYTRVKRTVKADDVDRAFVAKLNEVLERLSEVIVPDRAPVAVHQADARSVPFIKSGTVSLIVTSPPYLNTYDYHKYHRQRIHWLDGSVELARDVEIGSHDEFTKPRATPERYFRDMDKCFAEWCRVLRKDGRCFVVVGDAIVSGRPVPVADTFIELMSKQGMSIEKRWIRELQATKRAFNVVNSRISHEHILLFRKVNSLPTSHSTGRNKRNSETGVTNGLRPSKSS